MVASDKKRAHMSEYIINTGKPLVILHEMPLIYSKQNPLS